MKVPLGGPREILGALLVVIGSRVMGQEKWNELLALVRESADDESA